MNLCLLINTQFPFTVFPDFPFAFNVCAALAFEGTVLLLADTDTDEDVTDELELSFVSNSLTAEQELEETF